MAEHIRPQMESSPSGTDVNKVATMPVEVRAIYFLWMFYCEAGYSGMEVFLLEPHGLFTPQILDVLRLIGAFELVERLEAGIPHALASGVAEFSAASDLTWFEQFHVNPKYPTLQSVDVGSSELMGDAIRDKCNDFIKLHMKIFVA